MRNDTQLNQVLQHLNQHGSISSWTAIQEYRITRLAEYIRQLRQEGFRIESVWEESGKKRFVRYLFIKADQRLGVGNGSVNAHALSN